jgi:hypothetical protein
MKSTLLTYSLYELSNPHFQDVEVIQKDGKRFRGQFVQFRVVHDVTQHLYPAEKYCFLPESKKETFFSQFEKTNGEFSEFPHYVLQLGLHEIVSILIKPRMIV